MCSFCRRGGAGPVGAASARCCGRDARAFLSLRVGDVSERIDCGSRCLCRSSVAMSRAGKWRLNRRSLFPRNFRKHVRRRKLRYKALSEEKEERRIGAFWNLWFFLFPHAVTLPVREELSPSRANSNRFRLIRRRSESLCDPEILCGRISGKLLQKSAEVCRMRRPRDIRAMT